MTRDQSHRMNGTPKSSSSSPRKRSGDALIDQETPTKRRNHIISTAPESSSPRTMNSSSFGVGSDPFTTSYSTSSPALPSFSTWPMRSSLPADYQEDSKQASRAHTVDPGLAVLGEPVTKLVDLITTLRDNGIGRLDIDLPQIVVVGDQSTGKSSLIEGLSAIKVPRKEGTCTRCPLEINLKATNQPWHCRISIVRQYGYNVPSSEANPKLGLGPWNQKFTSALVEHFVDVNDKRDIPIYLARAQLAVLNPSKSVKTFAIRVDQELDSEITEEAFSPNVIRLDIMAPKLPSLSFFDLPGVIVQDVEPYVPNMIRNLVKSYITSSRSLVLLTVPMDNDRANSSSAGLVYEVKAQDRTIGIISKPDRLVSTNIEQWKDILSGKKFPLKLGYRVVMNPADARIEHSEARRMEREFFNTNQNFRQHLGDFRERFGTERLQESLSSQLLSMIRGCIPEINQKVQERVSDIEKELLTLPKPPEGNVVYEVQSRMTNLERLLTAAVNNTADFNTRDDPAGKKEVVQWFQHWHKIAQMFFEKLVRTAPRLDLTSIIGTPQGHEGEAIVIDSGSDDDSVHTPSKKKSSHGPATPQPASIPSSFSTRQQREITDAVEQYVKKFSLVLLRRNLHAVNGGVYGIGDPRVFEILFHQSIAHWGSLLKEFLRVTANSCKRLVSNLVDTVFADLKETELFRKVKASSSYYISMQEREQLGMSRRLLSVEKGKPLTLDAEGQENSRRLVLAQLNDQLVSALGQRKINEMKEADGKVSNADEKKIYEQARIDAAQHHQELHELAGTIAYYRVSARRFADYNSLTIRNEFFYSMRDRIWKQMSDELGIGPNSDISLANDHLKSMMVPSPRDYQRRKDLEHELDLLESTKKDVFRVLSNETVDSVDDMYGDDMDL